MKDDLKNIRKQFRSTISPFEFFCLIFLNIISAILFVIAPISINKVIQNVGSIETGDIITVMFLLASAYLVSFVAVFIKNDLYQKFMRDGLERMYRSVFRTKYDWYIEKGPTTLQDMVYNACDAYAGFYFDVIPNFILSIVTIVVTISIVVSFHLLAAFLMFMILPIRFFGFKLLNKKLSELSTGLMLASSESFKNINSIVSQVDFIKQNSDNSGLLKKIGEYIFHSEGVRKKVNYMANGVSGLLNGLDQMIQTFIIIFLSALALHEKEMFGSVVYVILVFPYFSNGIRNLSFVNIGVAEKKSADKIIISVINETEESGTLSKPEAIDKIRVDISKLKIGEKFLLKDICCTFQRGDIVAIQGESGSGKSTLAKLIAKFRVSDGIFINEIPLKDIDNDFYRKRVSYYSQNAPIVSGSLSFNLNFGREKVLESEYKKLKFLKKFRNFEEKIVENGANLSGGDKQRIALARFFTENSDVVILDEPTSSLDKNTEKELLNEILKDSKDKIIFIISHNPEIYRYCNRLFEVRDGGFKEIKQ